MKTIDKHILDALTQEAKQSDRLRKNKNYHPTYEDPINRMLNAFEPGTYIQPHKHEDPDKREVFVLLRGRLGIMKLDEKGTLLDSFVLEQNACPIVEFAPGEWHSVVSLESGTIVYEIKDGPYVQAIDKNFASWAPKEGEERCDVFVKLWEKLF